MDDQQMMEQQLIDQRIMEESCIHDPVKRDMIHHDWTKPTGKANWQGVLVLVVFVLIMLTIFLLVT
jgi:hypothetical protein